MELPMFVFADSDIDEEELRSIFLKLKKKFSKVTKSDRAVQSSGTANPVSRKRNRLTDISDCYCNFCNTGRTPQICDRENSSSREDAATNPSQSNKIGQNDSVLSVDKCENFNLHEADHECENHCAKKRKSDRRTRVADENQSEDICSSNCDIVNTNQLGKLESLVKEIQDTLCSPQGFSEEETNISGTKYSKSEDTCTSINHHCASSTTDATVPRTSIDVSRYVAMDCEFVGVGPKKTSALGRCTVLDYHGNLVIDLYATPEQSITDYRTRWSGIRKRDMISAIPFQSARTIIRNILKDKIVIGHALFNDFKVLAIKHPKENIRDTGSHKPLRSLANLAVKQGVSLKKLSKALLGRMIQSGEHCSAQDSLAALDLYKLVQADWEEKLVERRRKRSRKENYADQKSLRPDISKFEVSYLADEFWPSDLFEKYEDTTSI